METRSLIERLRRKNEDGSLAEITEEDQQAAADALERLTQPVGVEPVGWEYKIADWSEEQVQRVEPMAAIWKNPLYSAETVARLQAERDEWKHEAMYGGHADQLRAEVSRLTAENERLSALADKWNLEGDEVREDNKRLAAELAEIKNSMAYRTSLVGRLTKELAELRAQEPVEIHQWRRNNGDGRWRDATKEEAYSRVDEHYEARTLYARPVPAAQAVPDGFVMVKKEIIDRFNEINPSNYAPATKPTKADK